MFAPILMALSSAVASPTALAAQTAAKPELAQLGGFVSELTDLDQPSAAAFAPSGEMLVVESFRHRVLVFDRERHRLREIGGWGGAPGKLCDPHGIALAPSEAKIPPEIYVADTANHRVAVFAFDGTFVRTLGKRGHGPGELDSPRGLAVNAQHVFVADTRNHRIVVFERGGAFVRSFGSYGGGDGELRFPADVALDAAGHVYIADQDNHRVVKTDAQGRVLGKWGSFGPHPGQLASPTGVEVAGERVFVADRDNHRIAVFDTQGTRLSDWGIHALRPHEGAGKLHYPDQIALDADATHALVVEGFENRCQLFGAARESDLAATLGQERNTAAHFGASVDAAGELIVATEPGAPGMLVLDTTLEEPVEITRWGGLGTRLSQFVRPEAIELDREARFAFVGDCGARRLSVYRVDRPAGQELRYEPALARLSVSIDFARLFELEESPKDRAPIEPLALEAGANGALFVLDAANDEIVELAADLGVRRRFARWGWGEGELVEPVDLALDAAGKRLFVVDAGAGRVRVFDVEGAQAKCVASFGGLGESPDSFVRPAGIACAADGSVYVSDEGAMRVLRFDAQGKFVSAFGKAGLARGELFKPRGLALDPKQRLIVIDYGNHRGLVFGPGGEFASSFGSRLFTNPLRAAPVKPR